MSFVALPDKVRARIYQYALVMDDSEFNLSQLARQGEWSSHRQQIIASYLHLPNQLFFVSRSISAEAREIFYEQTRFHCNDTEGTGLMRVRSITAFGLSHIRQLTVRLGATICRSQAPRDCHRRALDMSVIDGQLVKSTSLSQWTSLCATMAKHLQDDQLDLRLAIGASTPRTVQRFLEPLDKLPRLRALSVRLEPRRDPVLQRLIFDAVRRKTDSLCERPEGFKFHGLPLEICYDILEFSGLLASSALVYQPGVPGFAPHDCLRKECTAGINWRRGESICWCPVTHTAFSSARPCWQGPNPWFQLNKATLRMAEYVYYLKNAFEIWYSPHDSPGPGIPWTPARSAFLHGFSGVSSFQHSWALHISHIRFVFSSNELPYPAPFSQYSSSSYGLSNNAFAPQSNELNDWTSTIHFLSQRLNPGQLTLELELLPRVFPPRARTPAAVAPERVLHDRIVTPVKACRDGLKDFFVQRIVRKGMQYMPMIASVMSKSSSAGLWDRVMTLRQEARGSRGV